MDKSYPQKVYLLGDPYAEYRVPLRVTWRVFAAEVFAAGLGILLILTAFSVSGTIQQMVCGAAGLPLLILAGFISYLHIREIMTLLVVAPQGLARIRWGRVELFHWHDVTIELIAPGFYVIYRNDGRRITHVSVPDNRVSSAIERKYQVKLRDKS